MAPTTASLHQSGPERTPAASLIIFLCWRVPRIPVCSRDRSCLKFWVEVVAQTFKSISLVRESDRGCRRCLLRWRRAIVGAVRCLKCGRPLQKVYIYIGPFECGRCRFLHLQGHRRWRFSCRINTRGLWDNVDMKKKVIGIGIGALCRNLGYPIKVGCKLVAGESTGKRKLSIKVCYPSSKRSAAVDALKVEKLATSAL